MIHKKYFFLLDRYHLCKINNIIAQSAQGVGFSVSNMSI